MNTFDAPALPIPVQVSCKVKGDRHCATVSCAAVIAKVTRDHLMVDIAQGNPRYAPYGWAHNKDTVRRLTATPSPVWESRRCIGSRGI